MAWLRKTAVGIVVLLLLGLGGLLAYVLPQHRVVLMDGTEVRRNDNVTVPQNGMPTRLIPGSDVYYIHASNPQRTDVYVFRNEDTGFGFPWYLKMDSAEVQGRAQLLARKEGQLALVTYYGWRIPLLHLFPNAVDIESWDSLEEPLPIFNIVLLTVLALVLATLAWKWRRWRRARAQKRAALQQAAPGA